MVRFSEREYAALNREAREPEPIATKTRRRASPMRWRCKTDACGEIIESEAAMRRHLPVHGVGAAFECLPE